VKTSIREYCEEMVVEVFRLELQHGELYKSVVSPETYQAHIDQRWVVKAFNEGGCNSTEVDLVELLEFVKKEMPELWKTIDDA